MGISKSAEKTSIEPVYILFGNDSYSKLKFEKEKEQVLKEQYGAVDRIIYSGKETKLQAVENEALESSLFSSIKLIIIREADVLFNKDFSGFLSDYSKRKDLSAVIIVETEKKKTGFPKGAATVKTEVPYENKLPEWINKEMTERGKKISHEASALLIFYCGRNLFNISNEIEKLILSFPQTESYSVEDVMEVSGSHRKDDIFGYLDSLVQKDEKTALKLLENLLDYGAEPLQILSMLKWKLQQMITAKALMEKGLNDREVIRKAALNPPFLYRNFCLNLRKFEIKKLFELYDRLHEMDVLLKTSAGSGRLLLENFSIRISSD